MSGAPDRTLAEWLETEGIVATDPGAIGDLGRVRDLLLVAAREGRSVSYSELLGLLGHRFTRPKMRAVCRTLDAVDAAAVAAGEPELAVLVVRESDRLPGQGWWIGASDRYGYMGEWQGPAAQTLIRERQGAAFDFWRGR